ncbi:MAG: DUF2797 domain-containing protein [Leptospiraceae bacterium]|nr:DUF2797 domain-containing protein [Leptospiraceae bacterium]
MQLNGNLRKLKSEPGAPIRYQLPVGPELVDLNERLGQTISMRFTGSIHCIACGRKTKKSFQQGFCFPCFQKSPEASECIIRPELCEGHRGQGRDPDWEKANHAQAHVVYLASVDAIKVGVTRSSQVPTRWIDQGAEFALIIARTPHRQLAGQIEVALKGLYKDKTNWQSMLKNKVLPDQPNLKAELPAIKAYLSQYGPDLVQYIKDRQKQHHLIYPVDNYPLKVKSLGFDKQELIEGTLLGIRGQYLLLDQDRVLNIRKHAGYEIELTI